MWTVLAFSFFLLINKISNVKSDCQEVIFGGPSGPTTNYMGAIKYLSKNKGTPTLSDSANQEYMEFLVGCSNYAVSPTAPRIVEEEYANQFVFTDIPTKVDQKALKLREEFNIVTTQDIIFHVEACFPEDASQCTQVAVTVTYPFNSHRPQFNAVSGEGTLADAELCSEVDPLSNPECKVYFTNPFYATDQDGDTVSYRIIPPTLIFIIEDETDLQTLYYSGVGISKETSIPLLIEARDTRNLEDEKITVALVTVLVNTSAVTSTTESSTTTVPEDDSKEKLYFILMIVFVCLFGVLLLAVLCSPLFLKLCRSNKVLGVTGPMSRKATFKKSGVFMSNATFKSNTNLHFMNYENLEERNGSQSNSPDLDCETERSGRIKKKSKKSSRNLSIEAGDDGV